MSRPPLSTLCRADWLTVMARFTLVILSCLLVSTLAWSVPYYPVRALHRGPHRFIRHVRHIRPQRLPIRMPVRDVTAEVSGDQQPQWERPKRDHDYDIDHDHDYGNEKNTRGVTGPVHTFVKTDKNANYKWGVRHHVGNKFAS